MGFFYMVDLVHTRQDVPFKVSTSRFVTLHTFWINYYGFTVNSPHIRGNAL